MMTGDPNIIEPWEAWVRSTFLHEWVHTYFWIWPIAESLHFIGLSLLIGSVGLFDLRVLGLARDIPAMALHRLIPFGLAGFALNILTGIVFFAGFPEQYAYNRAFHFKLAFLALAGLNAALFYATVLKDVRRLPAGADAPLKAKLATGISLGAWVMVLVCGRLLTFFRPGFFH